MKISTTHRLIPSGRVLRSAEVPTLSRFALMAALSAGVAFSATAQTGTTGSTTGSQSASTAQSAQNMKDYRGLRASQVIGMSVRNPQGNNIGQISDMIVDMNSGEVRYAILTFDPGILEGEKLFAVPTTELRMAADRDDIVYDMRRERLERAGVNRGEWDSTFRDRDYLANLDRVWGITQPSNRANAYRVSDLLGKDVNDRRGEDIGEVEELVIDMANQRVHYAVLEFDPSWTAPERNYAFPLRAFELGADRDELVLDIDRSRVQAMRSFTDDRYANLNDRVWVVDVDRYLVTVVPASSGTRTSGTTSGETSSGTSTSGTSSAGATAETTDADRSSAGTNTSGTTAQSAGNVDAPSGARTDASGMRSDRN